MAKTFSPRDFDGIQGFMHPEKADADDNKRAVEKLVDLLNTKKGQATIGAGNSSVVVSLGLDYANAPALAVLNFVDATALYVQAAVVDAAGDLTITVNANATADTLVSYQVQG